MWLIALIGVIAIVVLLVFYILIMNSLTEFETDRINPIDICVSLEKYIRPLMIAHAVTALMTLVRFRYLWIVTIYNIASVAYYFQKTRKHKFFEPLTIVREITKKKVFCGFHIGCIVICFVIMLVATILLLFL